MLTIDRVRIIGQADWDADTSYLEQDEFADELQSYRNGDFGFIGIRAEAVVLIPYGLGSIHQTITSPGLWGIEDISGRDYLESVGREELDTLRDMLTELCVTAEEIDRAFAEYEFAA